MLRGGWYSRPHVHLDTLDFVLFLCHAPYTSNYKRRHNYEADYTRYGIQWIVQLMQYCEAILYTIRKKNRSF